MKGTKTRETKYDAVVIGSGPNGLAAAITMAREGLSVKVFEAADTVGGGTRTKELTLPGFKHDICSAIHPMAKTSPFLRSLPLEEYGLEWIYPEYPLAHPLDNEPAAVLYRSLSETVKSLGNDGRSYQKLFEPLVQNWNKLAPQLLGPLSLLPDTPLLMARFGLKALQSAESLAGSYFSTPRAQALFAGLAAHSILPLDKLSTSAIGLVLGAVGHVENWPYPKGGSQAITNTMADYFKDLGGEIETGRRINSLAELPTSKTILFNTTPAQLLDIAGDYVPSGYAGKLKKFKYGAGVFKIDLALSEPIPWKDEACRKAGTVHAGGTLEEIVNSEQCLENNSHPEKPYVLVAQQSLFDETRAPKGKHTCWAYCHVPSGSTKDMTEPILNQIERFAPGFRDLIIGQHTMNTQAMQNYNPNYIGGDINGGKQDITQLFTRPAGLFDPYHVPDTNMYLSSSSTPPGGGVHGMCGYHAAQSALKQFR
ncbi:NAD(P)/FAD-dependent oxidoreductase [Balneolaceae bacterium YR4-1]|uniref:NAD(P)/FAD-dependent oxidoreductase n=1 Tax=Halalkalibaculum roseum TaxID=2709311 RepID=A0A6M1SVX5_9BACT|nr:NAD(P)/FAD-dependent oxidoreductase [Halalkalibaculum roseum]NGP76288.1 NAD(P)/FAD-dependent oxidoreductase [Halalkalibaculum roseum]